MHEDKIRTRHLAYFVSLVEQAEPELYGPNQVFWFNKLEDELDNFRAALEWALATDLASGLRIASIPWRFWQRRAYRQEALTWLSLLLARYPTSDSLRAHALAVYSVYTDYYGSTTKARTLAEQGLQLARNLSDQQNEALSLFSLGKSIAGPGDRHEGIPLLEKSRALYRTLGDKIGQAITTGWLAINHNDLKHSKSLSLESLKLHRALGNLSGIAWCLTVLAYHTIFEGDFSSPGPWLEEAKTLYRQLGDQPNEADVLETSGMLAERQGDYERAYTYFEQAITIYENIGISSSWPRVRMGHAFVRQGYHQRAREIFELTLQQFQEEDGVMGVVYTIEGFASLHVKQGRYERATRIFAWADAVREKLDDHRPPVEQADVDKDLAACLAQLNEVAFSDAYDEGKKMSVEEAIECALKED